ncbi:MAG: homoserine dehydrogenase [Candidatus Diapherotrites archaeon]
MKGNKLKIGLLGFGTVGQGVFRGIRENRKLIKQRAGLELEVKKICVRNKKKKRSLKVSEKMLTTKAEEIINDREIDVVVELMGGIEPAKTHITNALRKGKFVVTANKALLARHGTELFREAERNKADIYFEASVCGGIPIILALSLGLSANRIKSMHGILNGTCNYILTKMSKEGKGFGEALKEAQEKGFAEANPAFDVEGLDARQKLAILASLAFNAEIGERQIFAEGITGITDKDIEYAKEMGYCIKLLGIAKNDGKKLELRVCPAMIPLEHPLAAVSNEFNAVLLDGDLMGEQLFYGKGAGSGPTASAVIADLINVGQDIANKSSGKIHLMDLAHKRKKGVKAIGETESKYYLRMKVKNQAGVLAKIAKALGENNASIETVVQKEPTKKNAVIVLMLYNAREKNIRKALEEIAKTSVLKGKPRLIRVEDI